MGVDFRILFFELRKRLVEHTLHQAYIVENRWHPALDVNPKSALRDSEVGAGPLFRKPVEGIESPDTFLRIQCGNEIDSFSRAHAHLQKCAMKRDVVRGEFEHSRVCVECLCIVKVFSHYGARRHRITIVLVPRVKIENLAALCAILRRRWASSPIDSSRIRCYTCVPMPSRVTPGSSRSPLSGDGSGVRSCGRQAAYERHQPRRST